MSDLVVFLYFFEKTAVPEPIHLMTEVTSILDSICKRPLESDIPGGFFHADTLQAGFEPASPTRTGCFQDRCSLHTEQLQQNEV